MGHVTPIELVWEYERATNELDRLQGKYRECDEFVDNCLAGNYCLPDFLREPEAEDRDALFKRATEAEAMMEVWEDASEDAHNALQICMSECQDKKVSRAYMKEAYDSIENLCAEREKMGWDDI